MKWNKVYFEESVYVLIKENKEKVISELRYKCKLKILLETSEIAGIHFITIK
jgi:hypothetical protein